MINYDLAGHLEDLLTRPGLMYPFEYIARAVGEYNKTISWNIRGYAYISRKGNTIKINVTDWKELYFSRIPGTIYYVPVNGLADNPEEEEQKICNALNLAI